MNFRANFVIIATLAVCGCAFEPVKQSYSKSQAKITKIFNATVSNSLLVFRTSGFKLWSNQDAEVLVNGEQVAYFKAGGARYLPLELGINKIVVKEPEHFMHCELEFEFAPNRGQFVEIYERFDPGAMMVSFVFADIQSRLMYDPHPGTNCTGVYGLSMGYLNKDQQANIAEEFSFQVSQR